MGEKIHLELTGDEALVLFEFLSRYSNNNILAIEDQAEQQALWDLRCLLEKQLLQPFLPEYDQLLQQARTRLTSDPS